MKKTIEERREELNALWRQDAGALLAIYRDRKMRTSQEMTLPPAGSLMSQIVEMILEMEYKS